MFTTVWSRIIAVLTLVALLFGLAVWYGSLAPAPALGAYPNQEELGTNYEQYLGERVTVGGRVVDTDPVTIRATYGAGDHIQMTVTDLDSTPTEGDSMRVYGVATPDQTIRAINAVAVPQWGRWYTWSVSFLAGLWVLVRLGRSWRLETADWTLTPRETRWTPPLIDRLRTHIHREE